MLNRRIVLGSLVLVVAIVFSVLVISNGSGAPKTNINVGTYEIVQMFPGQDAEGREYLDMVLIDPNSNEADYPYYRFNLAAFEGAIPNRWEASGHLLIVERRFDGRKMYRIDPPR